MKTGDIYDQYEELKVMTMARGEILIFLIGLMLLALLVTSLLSDP